MKLVIREYLGSLRERGELDAVLPDMLTEMGFTVYSRPSVGTRQHGVDVAAVGRGLDGVRRVHLFSVKSGDLARVEWDTASPQSLRPSLNEIRDAYIPSRIPPEYAHLPVVICLCFGGDIDESVRAEVMGYMRSNTTPRVTYEEWNGDRLAQAILDGILREELLPAPLRSHLRKAVAMIEEPDIAIGHFATLVRELIAVAEGKPRDRLRRARLVNICLWILFVWAREAENVEAPYRASELAILSVWHMLNRDLGKKTKSSIDAGMVFNELVELHFAVWHELYAKKILPHSASRHALSTAIGSYSSVDVNLKLFDTVGRIALHGLWLIWLVSGNQPLPAPLGGEVDEEALAHIDRLGSQLVEIVGNNRALLSPIGDWQAIDLGLVFTFLACRQKFQAAVDQWVEAVSKNTIFAWKTHGLYPTTQRSYWDLVEHPAERTDDYRREATEGSILYPMLALWATAVGNMQVLEEIATFHTEDMPWSNYQTWLPDEDSEAHLYLGAENHGAALSQVPIKGGTRDTLEFIYEECSTNPHFDRLSAIKLGHWPILLTACRKHRLPIPPHVWRNLLPDMKPLQQAAPVPLTRPVHSRPQRLSIGAWKVLLQFSASYAFLGAGIAYPHHLSAAIASATAYDATSNPAPSSNCVGSTTSTRDEGDR